MTVTEKNEGEGIPEEPEESATAEEPGVAEEPPAEVETASDDDTDEVTATEGEGEQTAPETAVAVEGEVKEEIPEEPALSAQEKVEGFLADYYRDDYPEFNPGDTVRVHYKIVEGSKERIQVFEGIVIAIKHGGLDKTFIVRKVSWNIGVERTFFFHSRKIAKIEVVRRGKVRRAKIYYLRDRVGKAARIKELRKPKKVK